jgi:small redox-active disulfide protein 2
MITIKVLGSGCANCKNVEKIVRKVVADMGIEAEIIKITDYNEISSYDIFSTPGLVINEKVASTGRIPPPAEVSAWLANELETARALTRQ